MNLRESGVYSSELLRAYASGCMLTPCDCWRFLLEIIMDVMLSDSGLTMSSREIAELVESRHSDVVRSIERLMQSETIWNGYAPTAYTNPQNRQTYHCYMLNKRDSYVVVAQLSPQFTARLVDRWQELESQRFNIPTTLSGALRLAAEQAEQIEKQREQIAIAAPKVAFVDEYVDATCLDDDDDAIHCPVCGDKAATHRDAADCCLWKDLDAQTRWDIADAVQAGGAWGAEIMSAIGMRGK